MSFELGRISILLYIKRQPSLTVDGDAQCINIMVANSSLRPIVDKMKKPLKSPFRGGEGTGEF